MCVEPTLSLSEVLADANLGHLCEHFSGQTLESCAAQLASDGRPAFIKHIKNLGVEKLGDRQKVATVIGKAAKAAGSAGPPATTAARNQAWLSMGIAKEFNAEAFDTRAFANTLAPLKPLGGSPLMPGEPPDVCKHEARVRLIALYGTGYDAAAFAEWAHAAPDWLEMRVLELPGHGTREHEGLWSLAASCAADETLSNKELHAKLVAERDAFIRARVDELLPLILPPGDTRDDTPDGTPSPSDAPAYALYGFSSGALFAYLIVLELARRRAPLPFRLVVCGRAAPHIVWAPATVRLMRCGDAAEMDHWLYRGLAVPMAQPSKEGEEVDFASDTIRQKHAFWRAPLLTSALCAGIMDSASNGPFACDLEAILPTDGSAGELAHAATPPRLPVPLVVLSSTADKVWSFPLTQRWHDVAASENDYKFLSVGKLSHFSLMTSSAVIQSCTLELAQAAAAAAANEYEKSRALEPKAIY